MCAMEQVPAQGSFKSGHPLQCRSCLQLHFAPQWDPDRARTIRCSGEMQLGVGEWGSVCMTGEDSGFGKVGAVR